MAKKDHKAEYTRLVTSGDVRMIDGIPVRIPCGDEAAPQKQRKQIRKQLKAMMESGDPWARQKAEKWAHFARPRKLHPFWKRALADVNPRGNIYLGLLSKTSKGWIGRMAEFPKVVGTGRTLALGTRSLSAQLKAHLKAI